MLFAFCDFIILELRLTVFHTGPYLIMAEELFVPQSTDKTARYQSLIPQTEALIASEPDLTANLAIVVSVLKYGLDFFWVGFYIVKKDELVLGPFQGPIACTRIKRGKGVCGTS